jgi:DNA-binding NarL/FixJ family response regulator
VYSGAQAIASYVPDRKEARPQLNAKVVIADDHDIVREGIRRILTRMRPNWDICGEAENGEDAVKLVSATKPGVVVLDVTMPRMTGLEAARQISKMNLGCRILIFTVHDSDWLKAEIRNTGAHGYVQKSQVARDLVTAIERLLEGGTFFSDPSVSEFGSGANPSTNTGPENR